MVDYFLNADSLFNLSEAVGKIISPSSSSSSSRTHESDIQVSVEDDNILVIRSSGKRKRDDGDEEECKYIRLERVRSWLGSSRCQVWDLPPPPKPKTVSIPIS